MVGIKISQEWIENWSGMLVQVQCTMARPEQGSDNS